MFVDGLAEELACGVQPHLPPQGGCGQNMVRAQPAHLPVTLAQDISQDQLQLADLVPTINRVGEIFPLNQQQRLL